MAEERGKARRAAVEARREIDTVKREAALAKAAALEAVEAVEVKAVRELETERQRAVTEQTCGEAWDSNPRCASIPSLRSS